jgi:hypothetical protein
MEKNLENPKSPEDVLFSDLMAAEKEVETILGEIDEILRSSDDRKQAETIVLKSHAPRLEEAQRRAGDVLAKWLAFVKSEIGKE